MFHSIVCRAFPVVLVGALLIASGCGGGDDAGSGTPTTPTGPTNTTPPPSGVPNVSGTWNGTADFERPDNTHLITQVTLTITQNDRNIQGTARFPAAGFESWRGTFSGTISGTVDPEFLGTMTVQSEPLTGTGICSGTMTMSGRTTATSMRWDAPTLNLAPSAGPTEQPACLGQVRNIAWIFNR